VLYPIALVKKSKVGKQPIYKNSIKYTQGTNPSDRDIKTLQIPDKEMEPWYTVAKIFYPNKKTIVFRSKDTINNYYTKTFFHNSWAEAAPSKKPPANTPTVSLKDVELFISKIEEKRKQNRRKKTREEAILEEFKYAAKRVAKEVQDAHKIGQEIILRMTYADGSIINRKVPISQLCYTRKEKFGLFPISNILDWEVLCSSTCNDAQLVKLEFVPDNVDNACKTEEERSQKEFRQRLSALISFAKCISTFREIENNQQKLPRQRAALEQCADAFTLILRPYR
jgi:hypothetical protein